jgi:hypothetical protein
MFVANMTFQVFRSTTPLLGKDAVFSHLRPFTYGCSSLKIVELSEEILGSYLAGMQLGSTSSPLRLSYR